MTHSLARSTDIKARQASGSMNQLVRRDVRQSAASAISGASADNRLRESRSANERICVGACRGLAAFIDKLLEDRQFFDICVPRGPNGNS